MCVEQIVKPSGQQGLLGEGHVVWTPGSQGGPRAEQRPVKNSLSLEFRDRAPRTSATGGLLPSLTKLVPLDPKGPEPGQHPMLTSKLPLISYQAWRAGRAARRTCPRRATRKSSQEGRWEPSRSPGRKQRALAALMALRRLWFPLWDAGNTLAPEMSLQQLTNAKQSSSRLTTQRQGPGGRQSGTPPRGEPELSGTPMVVEEDLWT